MQKDKSDAKSATSAIYTLLRLIFHPRLSAIAGAAGLVAAVYDLSGGDLTTRVVLLVFAIAIFFVASLLLDRHLPPRMDIEIMKQAVNILISQQLSQRLSRAKAAKEVALSLTYLRHYKRVHSSLKLALAISAGLFGMLSFKYPEMELISLSLVPIAFLGLITIKETLVEYRIRKGLFGTNQVEARALINFMIRNADDIDFTDSNGKLRRALLPESEGSARERPQDSPDGVTA